MSPWKGNIFGGKGRGIRITWKCNSPFCQWTVIQSVPPSFPQHWIMTVHLIWAPLLMFKVLFGVQVLVYPSAKTRTALFPLCKLGLERTDLLLCSDCSPCVHRGAGCYISVSSQCWERQWYRLSVYFYLWPSKRETDTLVLKGQKHSKSPLLIFFCSVFLLFYFMKYLTTTTTLNFFFFSPSLKFLQNQWTASRETNKCPSTFFMCGMFVCFLIIFVCLFVCFN